MNSPTDSDHRQQIADALRELTQAWRRLLLYPSGHPERANVSQRAVQALRGAIGEREELALGVARGGFVVAERMHSDLGARELANLLYRHNVAVVRVRADLDSDSFEQFLESLRFESGAHQEPILGSEQPTRQWPGIRMENADYSSLLAAEETQRADGSAPHRLNLWERILQLQLRNAGKSGDAAGYGDTSQLQSAVKRIFSGLPREMLSSDFSGDFPQQVQQVVELLQVAVLEHLREAVQKRRLIDLREVDELLGDLPAGVAVAALELVLSKLADDEEEKIHLAALLAAVDGEQALLAARRLRDRSFRFSASALLSLRDLADRMDEEKASLGQAVPEALQATIDDGRDAARLPPEDAFVFRFGRPREPAVAWPPALEPLRATLQPGSVQLALLNGLCELLALPHLHERSAAGLVPRIEELFGDLLETGHPMAALAVVHSLRDLRASHETRLARPIDDLLGRVCGESIATRLTRMLASADDRLRSQMQNLVTTLGDPLIASLVNHLAEEEDRARRRALFDFLKTFHSQVIPAARHALSDPRWFVVRNMVVLLDEIDDRGAAPYLHRVALHRDLRVRAAVVRALARLDRHLPAKLIGELLATPDPAFVERTMQVLGRARMKTAVQPLCELLQRGGGKKSKTLRLRAIEALGLIGHPDGLAAVRPLLGALRLHGQDERRAVYRSLGGYPPGAIADLVRKGLKSRDAEIRDLCQRLERGEDLSPSTGPSTAGMPPLQRDEADE